MDRACCSVLRGHGVEPCAPAPAPRLQPCTSRPEHPPPDCPPPPPQAPPARWWCVRSSALQLAWMWRTWASAAKKAGPTSSPCQRGTQIEVHYAAASRRRQARGAAGGRHTAHAAWLAPTPHARQAGASWRERLRAAARPHLQGGGLCGRELVLLQEPPHQLAPRLAGLRSSSGGEARQSETGACRGQCVRMHRCGGGQDQQLCISPLPVPDCSRSWRKHANHSTRPQHPPAPTPPASQASRSPAARA